MMKTTAVICEYNPMHAGHVAQIAEMHRQSGGAGTVVCLMSGDFVQRGEPAVFDKYARARTAVERGADLVLELPYPWSASVAEHFASGAISILRRLGVVDDLYFGSEGKDERTLSFIAQRLDCALFGAHLAELRQREKCLSYPKLRDLCYEELYGEKLLLSSNEILGLEYCKQLRAQNASFSPHALPMLEGQSASALRAQIKKEEKTEAAFLENGSCAILAHLILEGRCDRFSRAAHGIKSLDELFSAVRTSSDTDARLRRELLSVVLESSGREKEEPAFTVLLAANGRGRELLSRIRKTKDIEIITKQAAFSGNETARKQYALYLKAQSFYSFFAGEAKKADELLKKKPYITKN